MQVRSEAYSTLEKDLPEPNTLAYCTVESPLVNEMEQHTLKNVNNCLNANIYSYLETSGANVIKLEFTAIPQ